MKEAAADLRRAVPMNRLLQGDVGSGKTVVAAACAYFAWQNGCQAALMAPTELLPSSIKGPWKPFWRGQAFGWAFWWAP